MRWFFSLFLLVTTVCEVCAQSGWQRIPSPSNEIWKSYFWSIDSGFAARSQTFDGGKTWTALTLPADVFKSDSLSSYSLQWTDFFATNSTTIFATGSVNQAVGPVYFREYYCSSITTQTSNAGISWEGENFSFGSSGGGLLEFQDQLKGFVLSKGVFCNSIAAPLAAISVTRDGGLTWCSIVKGGGGRIFNDADFLNDSLLIVTSGEETGGRYDKKIVLFQIRDDSTYFLDIDTSLGILISPSINGVPWKGEISRISCIADPVLLGFNGKQLIRSTDRGANWSIMIDSCHIYDIETYDSTAYVALYKDNASWVYASRDAGATWTPQLTTQLSTFFSLSIPSDSDGGGTTLSVSPKAEVVETLQVHPNPAGSYVSVSGNVGPLHVYDAFGREVRAPLIGQQLDVSTWAAGVYVVSDGKSIARFLVLR